jgi:heat-inducible transcriptional repressor
VSGLTERQETLLGLVVHEYVENAQPVGSERLVEKYSLGVSSATVRHEMVMLTEAGYLRQPHPSAGRIPSEEGYRYFVRRLIGETELPVDEKRLISHQFHQARGDVDEWVRLAAAVLAQHSRVASLVTPPHSERAAFKQLRLISTQGRQVLMVVVLSGGEVRQQMLTLAEEVSQERLDETSAHVNRVCAGSNSAGLLAQAGRASGLERDVIRLAADVMARADAVSSGELHRDGLTNVLAQPEFADSESARHALLLLEERSFLEEVLAKALSPGVGSVQVVIGGEDSWEELKDCSMVLARYGAPGYATGALGVLGPLRMAYGRTISAVRYVAGLMSDLVVDSYARA